MSNADYDRWFSCLNDIKPVRFLPRLNAMTIPLAAEYFGVDSHKLNAWCIKRKLPLMELGMRRLNTGDVTAAGYEVAKANPIAACQLDDVRFTMCSLDLGSYFLTRNCLCYMAFNLYGSEVAEVFRKSMNMGEIKDNEEKRENEMVYGVDCVRGIHKEELMELTYGADTSLRVARVEADRTEPWFIAIDACNALKISNSTSALRHIPNGTFKRISVFRPDGGTSTMNVVNRQGMIGLIDGAKRADPEVVRWINDTVFPAVGLESDETLPMMISNTDNADKENSEDVLVVTPDAITNSSDDIRVFNNSEYGELRTMMIDGEPWFVAVDVCRALEIDRTATRRLDDDEKGVYSTHTLGGKQEMAIINEPGLYSLVLGSRKPEAKAFKRWITHNVIPSLRKHGAYIVGQETMTETELIAKALIASHRIAEEREAQLKQAKAELKLREEVASLQTEKIALIGEVQTWDYRSIINALMRKYAAETNKLYSVVYNELYRQINYKLHINLKQRMPVKNEKGYLARAKEEELPDITKVTVAMCEEIGMDIVRVINEVNAERQLSPN